MDKPGNLPRVQKAVYVNLGRSYEMLGNQAEARRYYKLSADLGLVHQADE